MRKTHSSKRREVCVVTFGRSWNAVAATRALGAKGVEVITGDNLPITASNFSFHSKGFFSYPDPDKHPREFIEQLVKVCRKHARDDTDVVLMPIHTDSFIVSENISRFDGIAKLALPPYDKIKLLGNKASLARFCAEKGINTPMTKVIKDIEQLRKEAENFSFPAFLKITDSNAAIGLHKVKSPDEAVSKLEEDIRRFKLKGKDIAILQEAVPGEDFCATFLFDHGERRASMTYHNILDYPKKTGMGALRETVDATDIEAVGSRLLEMACWHGVAEIDFRWDGVNPPLLIEVNPRFWGGLGQSIESGWDYPYMLFRLAVDGHVAPAPPGNKQVKTFNPCLMSLLMLQEFVEAKNTRGELGIAIKTFEKELQSKKDHFKTLDNFSDMLSAALNPLDRLKAVKSVLDTNKGAVNELFKKRDPLPLLGLLYPLAVFLKHGKITPEMLVTGAGKSDDSN
ncbi:MAG: ATP-grasp domain-containing protein [Victivallales bacterium]|nr:ATP-grasp domain-containing protein [Victivallales bacterium]